MIGAIVVNNVVTRRLVIDEGNVFELERAMGCEIVDAAPYGLTVGDLRTARGWTRNAGGEQMLLPLLEREQYDGYTLAVQQVAQLEEQNAELESNQANISEATANEALAILTGEVE